MRDLGLGLVSDGRVTWTSTPRRTISARRPVSRWNATLRSGCASRMRKRSASRNSRSSKFCGQRAVGRLDEQVGAALVEGGEAQVLVGRALGPEQVDLGAGHHAHAELGRYALVQLRDGRGEVAGPHSRVIGPQMRRGGEGRGALARGRPDQRQALLDGVGAVVDSGQHMGVEVDHGCHCPQNGVPAHGKPMTRLLYWLAVVIVSLALLVALVLLLESRDSSSVSRANTTIRSAALYSGWQAVSTSRG